MSEIGGGVDLHIYCDADGCKRFGKPVQVYEKNVRACRRQAKEAGWVMVRGKKASTRSVGVGTPVWLCPECANKGDVS